MRERIGGVRVWGVMLLLSVAGALSAGEGVLSGEGALRALKENTQAAPRFSGCAELGAYIRDVKELGYHIGEPMLFGGTPGVDMSPMPISLPNQADVELEHSTTNLQEEGVDEADIVKMSGEYTFTAMDGHFVVFRTWPLSELDILFAHELEGHGVGLFVTERWALVFSRIYRWDTRLQWSPRSYAATKLEIFDIAEPAAPILKRELYIDGNYNTSRLVDGRLHMVIESDLHDYYTPPEPMPLAGLRGDEGRLPRFSLPAPLEVAGLVPLMQDEIHDGLRQVSDTRPLSACEDFVVPPRKEGANMVTIASLGLEDPLGELHTTTVLTDYATVYASADRLYLAAQTAEWWAYDAEEVTLVHRFALGERARLEAVGEVPGVIINRYSLGEHDGYLRIATVQNRWWWAAEDPVNTLFVLGVEGDKLIPVGELGGLGHEGERIYAVRFMGDRGYLVTFRETDPLYTLDLSDPNDPRVVGELKIPGFSTYLHPMDDDFLLGIGQDPDLGTTDLSLYDVSDFAAPRLVDRVSLGEWSYSEALWEPKAFNWFEPAGLLSVPASGYFSGDWSYGARVYGVDRESGFEERGWVEHPGLAASQGYNDSPAIRRTLFVGEGEGWVLYTLSDQLLMASDTEEPGVPLGLLRLPGNDEMMSVFF